MKLYQIKEVTETFNNAGTKANQDISDIAERLGFKPVTIRMNTVRHSAYGKMKRQAGYYSDWKNAVKIIPESSVVLLQHPFHHKQLTREKNLLSLKAKRIKFISVVHDVEELRGFRYSDYYRREFEFMLEIADMIIVHNERMKQWFEEQGVSADKLITLDIFDYLLDKRTKGKEFVKSLTIAGNLDTSKSGYIAELGKLPEICFDLYGANFDPSIKSFPNIAYHGEYPIDVIPSKLSGGFGLVWDGNSIDGCKGQSGQYLQYNNPHKLSLYLASGLPVVIWEGAAEAAFVKKYDVGFCVESLEELSGIMDSVDASEYAKLCTNAGRLSEGLCSGEYAEKAIAEALHRIEKNEN